MSWPVACQSTSPQRWIFQLLSLLELSGKPSKGRQGKLGAGLGPLSSIVQLHWPRTICLVKACSRPFGAAGSTMRPSPPRWAGPSRCAPCRALFPSMHAHAFAQSSSREIRHLIPPVRTPPDISDTTDAAVAALPNARCRQAHTSCRYSLRRARPARTMMKQSANTTSPACSERWPGLRYGRKPSPMSSAEARPKPTRVWASFQMPSADDRCAHSAHSAYSALGSSDSALGSSDNALGSSAQHMSEHATERQQVHSCAFGDVN